MHLSEGNYGFHFLEGSFTPFIALQSIGIDSRSDSSYYFENTHRPDHYLFQYTFSGIGTVEIDGQPQVLGPGQAFFLRTPGHLSRTFTRDTGMTPIAFLTRKRLERAVELVYTGGLTNDEIARRCGFSSGNYLCKLFRRYLGASPHALRAQPYHVTYTRITLY